MKAATNTSLYSAIMTGISIHAAREGGDKNVNALAGVYDISIHAAREGGDGSFFCPRYCLPNFNPRRP